MKIAYSLLTYQRLGVENKSFVKNTFTSFEHTPSTLKLGEFVIEESHVTGIQGLLYGLDESYTMSGTYEEFDSLYNHLEGLFQEVPFRTDFIFGSPKTRRIENNNEYVLFERAKILNRLATEHSQNLYFEALPVIYCDFINQHEELLSIKPRIHVDTATLLTQGINPSWFHDNLAIIDRIHLSIPGYTSSFRKFASFFTEMGEKLGSFEGKLVIEVQDVDVDFKEDIEWLCAQF